MISSIRNDTLRRILCVVFALPHIAMMALIGAASEAYEASMDVVATWRRPLK